LEITKNKPSNIAGCAAAKQCEKIDILDHKVISQQAATEPTRRDKQFRMRLQTPTYHANHSITLANNSYI
jgi:hypothetical protein